MPPPDRSFRSLRTATMASGTLAKAFFRHLFNRKRSLQSPRPAHLGPDRESIDLFLYEFAIQNNTNINRVLQLFNRAMVPTTGHSMMPTCSGDNQMIWIDISHRGCHNIRKGDTVTAVTPGKKRYHVHKRVMAGAGDTFITRLGRSRVNEVAKVCTKGSGLSTLARN